MAATCGAWEDPEVAYLWWMDIDDPNVTMAQLARTVDKGLRRLDFRLYTSVLTVLKCNGGHRLRRQDPPAARGARAYLCVCDPHHLASAAARI